MARKKPKNNKLLNNIPLIVGLVLMFTFSIWRYHQERVLSFNSDEVVKVDSKGIKPVHVKSYPVGVDIDIKDTTITNGIWGVHQNYVNYLVNSAGLGDSGNIILYGHNENNVLGPIRYVKAGAIIEILGSDNKTYKYEVVKTDTVNPDNLEYIKPTDTETLTLYTCIGFFDSQRFIVVAKPKV